jgi:DMSO reductase anchor subunit
MKFRDMIISILLSTSITGILYFFDEKNMVGIILAVGISIILAGSMIKRLFFNRTINQKGDNNKSLLMK